MFGQPVTFTATVSPVGGSGTPTGTVTFQEGSTTLASSVTLVSGQATFSTASLSVGSHTITASYSGDASFLASMGNDSALPETVNKAGTTVALQPAPTPALSSVFGQAVTFTAFVQAVAPGAGTPSGTVTFSDGRVTIGAGVAGRHGPCHIQHDVARHRQSFDHG